MKVNTQFNQEEKLGHYRNTTFLKTKDKITPVRNISGQKLACGFLRIYYLEDLELFLLKIWSFQLIRFKFILYSYISEDLFYSLIIPTEM